MTTDPHPQQLIAQTIEEIDFLDEEAVSAADARQGQLTKPPGSLGRLEDLATRIAAITGEARPRLDQRLIVVAAADHGVTARGVSAYPAEVTGQMVANFLAGGAAINVLADHAGARVRVVDAGVATDTGSDPRLDAIRLGPGTADMTVGPAMSRELAERALAAGIAIVDDERQKNGLDLIGCGEMGIGNTTSAAAIIAAISGRPAAAVTGRGTGIDDATHAHKVEAIETALRVNRPDPADGVELLATVGGFEIGVLAGVYLGAAARRIPAMVDGVISGSAALIATTIEPKVRDYLIASHRSPEPGHTATLEALGLEPLLELDMRLGEGSGAALGMTICVAACRLLDEMATFEEAGVADSDSVVEPEG